MVRQTIRTEILNRRNSLSESTILKNSICIANQLYQHSVFQKADMLLLYASTGSEVKTDSILEKEIGLSSRKIYLPRVTDSVQNNMDFFEVDSSTTYQYSFHSIKEPVNGNPFIKEEKDYLNKLRGKIILMILPGVAFDLNGNRLGYGKGYYDRFIKKMNELKLSVFVIALAHNIQIVNHIPSMEHDMKYQFLITENKIYEQGCK